MTVREKKFVKAKLQGKSNLEATREAAPELKESSIAQTSDRLSKSVNVRQALDKALARHNITIDRILKPIDEALDASDPIYSKDGTFIETKVNHTVRLAASDRAAKLMGLDKPAPDKTPPAAIDTKALMEAIKSGDMVTLQQIIFNNQS